jgi:hypothetical protein
VKVGVRAHARLPICIAGTIIVRAVPYYLETNRFSLYLPNRANVAFDFAYFLIVFLVVGFLPSQLEG